MSLFSSILGDIDDDPFFGSHMRQMSGMMNNMNSLLQPFGGFLGPAMGSQMMPFSRQPIGGGLMPFGFPNMNHLLQNMDQIGNSPNCHSYSSSTVMTMTNGPDGCPQVYQASSSVRQGPGGLKETKKSVSDSRSGVKKLAIGHHIGERGHIIEREQNFKTGDQEERQDYINLDEDQAEDFNREWTQKARQTNSRPSINYPQTDRYNVNHRPHLLALPSSSSSETSDSPLQKSRKRQHHTLAADKPSNKPKISKHSDK